MRLDRLLTPRSIAVVGASERPDTFSSETLLNLTRLGFEGEVWGVNPRRSSVHGRACFPSLSALPGVPDAVVVAVPAAGVVDVIEEAGRLGCGGAVVYAAGFGESPSGVAHEAALREAADRWELPVCGPNCDGLIALHARAALWGDALAAPEPGPVALVSQSGNLVVNALATRRGLRLHTAISSGNETVLSTPDYVEHLAGVEGVRSIALLVEDDGDGARLCEALARCADAGVGVAVLKVGASAGGVAAAAAHTGAVAGDHRVFRALMREAGAAWADDMHDLLELAKALAVRGARPRRGIARGARPDDAFVRDSPHDELVVPGTRRDNELVVPGTRRDDELVVPGTRRDDELVVPGRRRDDEIVAAPTGLAILTCSGGDSGLGADEAALRGLELPALSATTVAALRERLPEAATIANPLDYTAMIWGERDTLRDIVRLVGEDPAIGHVLVFYDRPPGITGYAAESWDAVQDGLKDGAAVSPVPTLVASTLPELLDDAAAWAFCEAGVPAVAGLRTGVACAAALTAPPPDSSRLREVANVCRPREVANVCRPREVANVCRPREGGRWLAEHEAKALLRGHGIAVVEGRTAGTEEEAANVFRELGGPVALKLSGADVRHKNRTGALALNVRDEVTVRTEWRRLRGGGAGNFTHIEVSSHTPLSSPFNAQFDPSRGDEAQFDPSRGDEAQFDPSRGDEAQFDPSRRDEAQSRRNEARFERPDEEFVLIERMAPPGAELLVAVRTDSLIPVLVLGLGGVWTEALDDVAIVPLPATAARVERAIRGLRAAPALDRRDVPAAAELAARLGEIALEANLSLLECNPVLVHEQGAVVVDAAAKEVAT